MSDLCSRCKREPQNYGSFCVNCYDNLSDRDRKALDARLRREYEERQAAKQRRAAPAPKPAAPPARATPPAPPTKPPVLRQVAASCDLVKALTEKVLQWEFRGEDGRRYRYSVLSEPGNILLTRILKTIGSEGATDLKDPATWYRRRCILSVDETNGVHEVLPPAEPAPELRRETGAEILTEATRELL